MTTTLPATAGSFGPPKRTHTTSSMSSGSTDWSFTFGTIAIGDCPHCNKKHDQLQTTLNFSRRKSFHVNPIVCDGCDQVIFSIGSRSRRSSFAQQRPSRSTTNNASTRDVSKMPIIRSNSSSSRSNQSVSGLKPSAQTSRSIRSPNIDAPGPSKGVLTKHSLNTPHDQRPLPDKEVSLQGQDIASHGLGSGAPLLQHIAMEDSLVRGSKPRTIRKDFRRAIGRLRLHVPNKLRHLFKRTQQRQLNPSPFNIAPEKRPVSLKPSIHEQLPEVQPIREESPIRLEESILADSSSLPAESAVVESSTVPAISSIAEASALPTRSTIVESSALLGGPAIAEASALSGGPAIAEVSDDSAEFADAQSVSARPSDPPTAGLSFSPQPSIRRRHTVPRFIQRVEPPEHRCDCTGYANPPEHRCDCTSSCHCWRTADRSEHPNPFEHRRGETVSSRSSDSSVKRPNSSSIEHALLGTVGGAFDGDENHRSNHRSLEIPSDDSRRNSARLSAASTAASQASSGYAHLGVHPPQDLDNPGGYSDNHINEHPDEHLNRRHDEHPAVNGHPVTNPYPAVNGHPVTNPDPAVNEDPAVSEDPAVEEHTTTNEQSVGHGHSATNGTHSGRT